MQCLYIQMEYCERTLKDELESKQLWIKYSEEKIWQLFMYDRSLSLSFYLFISSRNKFN